MNNTSEFENALLLEKLLGICQLEAETGDKNTSDGVKRIIYLLGKGRNSRPTDLTSRLKYVCSPQREGYSITLDNDHSFEMENLKEILVFSR
jgi:hypothetical protein